ncbi:hypothetical protein X975_11580, partial [Stegodyphus mimosarum]
MMLPERWQKIRTALKSSRMLSLSLIPGRRCNAVASFRLSAEHGCLAAHLQGTGISSDPVCPLCDSGEDMNNDHLLGCGSSWSYRKVERLGGFIVPCSASLLQLM